MSPVNIYRLILSNAAAFSASMGILSFPIIQFKIYILISLRFVVQLKSCYIFPPSAMKRGMLPCYVGSFARGDLYASERVVRRALSYFIFHYIRNGSMKSRKQLSVILIILMQHLDFAHRQPRNAAANNRIIGSGAHFK